MRGIIKSSKLNIFNVESSLTIQLYEHQSLREIIPSEILFKVSYLIPVLPCSSCTLSTKGFNYPITNTLDTKSPIEGQTKHGIPPGISYTPSANIYRRLFTNTLDTQSPIEGQIKHEIHPGISYTTSANIYKRLFPNTLDTQLPIEGLQVLSGTHPCTFCTLPANLSMPLPQ